jgi:hypothetical protein
MLRWTGVLAVVVAVAALPGTAAGSTDHPLSNVLSPTQGSVLPLDTPVVISGIAVNGEQGGITSVEVSLDGGSTWVEAGDSESWQYVFTPDTPGPVTIVSRASTANTVETPTRSVTVQVGGGTPPAVSCPCRFLLPSLPGRPILDEDDPLPVEVGLRFRPDRDGWVTGLFLFRQPGNTGPDVAHLWTADGTLLATKTGAALATTITFDSPVAVDAGVEYVISYFTPTGHYASSIDYFAGAIVQAPFEAVYDEVGTAGVYRYDGGFPDQTWNASNYWLGPTFTT